MQRYQIHNKNFQELLSNRQAHKLEKLIKNHIHNEIKRSNRLIITKRIILNN